MEIVMTAALAEPCYRIEAAGRPVLSFNTGNVICWKKSLWSRAAVGIGTVEPGVKRSPGAQCQTDAHQVGWDFAPQQTIMLMQKMMSNRQSMMCHMASDPWQNFEYVVFTVSAHTSPPLQPQLWVWRTVCTRMSKTEVRVSNFILNREKGLINTTNI